MDYREASRILVKQITATDIARELGISIHAVRQARLRPGKTATGYRRPPEGWQRVFSRLARERARELDRLAERLEQDTGG